MKQLFEHFDSVRVLNLADRVDRRHGVLKELERLEVDLNDPRIDFHTAERFKAKNDFPSRGVRGSFISHREIMRDALNRGDETLLVIEDDVFFYDIEAAQVSAISAALNTTHWDLVYFGRLEPNDDAPGEPLTGWSGRVVGGHFYGVNREFMAVMVDFMDDCEKRPAGHPSGGPMFRDGAFHMFVKRNPEVRQFIAKPNLAGQRSSRSDLTPTSTLDDAPVLKDAVSAVRWVKNALRRR